MFLFGGFVWWYLHGWEPQKTSRILVDGSVWKGLFFECTCHSEKNRGLLITWMFPKIGVTTNWMVYNGKPYQNG